MVCRLFFSPISPPCRAVLMVLEALKLKDIKLIELNILTKMNSDLAKLNPQQTVPTLQDNEHVIWDSHVISTYLVNKYSKYDYLYPKDLTARSLVDQRLYFDGSILYPVIHNALYPILFHRKMGISAADRSNVQTNYKILEAFLNKYFWLCGNYMTIADLCCAASISTMDFMVPISQQDYPKLYEFLERCKKLPYYEMCNQTGLDQLISILQEKILISKASSTRI